MDKKQPFLHLLVVIFFFSCLLPMGAKPLSRRLALSMEVSALAPADQVITREVHVMREVYRRMDIELNDYPGSGANNRHDPKPPARP